MSRQKKRRKNSNPIDSEENRAGLLLRENWQDACEGLGLKKYILYRAYDFKLNY